VWKAKAGNKTEENPPRRAVGSSFRDKCAIISPLVGVILWNIADISPNYIRAECWVIL